MRLKDGSVLRISVSRATAFLLALGMLQPILIVLAIAIGLSAWLAHRMAKRVVEPLNETEGKGKKRSQRVVIHYRFIGILDYPQTEPAYTADTRKGVAVKYVTKSA